MPDRHFPDRGRRHVLALLLGWTCGGALAQEAFVPCQRLGRWRECVTVPLASAQQDREAKQFRPPAADRARLYIVRPGTMEPHILSDVILGEAQVAQLAPETYTVVDTVPGRHRIQIITGHHCEALLDFAAGSIHYLAYRPALLFNTVSGTLTELDEREGQALVLKSKLVKPPPA